MSKAQKTKPITNDRPIIPAKYQHAAAIVALFISLIIFFWGVIIEKKTFVASDSIASRSFWTLADDAYREGVFPLWNPYIFCGMPGYASLSIFGERAFDISNYIMEDIRTYFAFLLNKCDIGYIFFYYFILGIGVYLFVFQKLKNKLAAFLSAFGVMHSTMFIIFIYIGHMTKIPVLAFLPFIFLIAEKLKDQFRLWLFLVLILLVHFMLKPTHLQMIFYAYFALGLYYLFFLIRSFILKENWIGVLRSAALLGIASIIAVGMTADQYFSTYEYSKYSIRGSEPILSSQQNPSGEKNESQSGGLDYDYATNWSFSPGEILTFVIPSAYGFGWHQYQGILTRNQSIRLNTYFGPQLSVDGPHYVGIVILALGIIGFWRNRKDPFIQYLGILIIISVFISFGRELPLLYNLMYYYFPTFNKFRAPNMILSLVEFFMPILAGYGIHSLMNDARSQTEAQKKLWRYAFWGLAILTFLSVVAKDVFIGIYQIFVSQSEAITGLGRAFGQNSGVLEELYRVVTEMIATDITVMFLLLTIALGAMYFYWDNKIKLNFLIILFSTITIFDLWRVNYKPMETFPHHKLDDMFTAPGYIKYLHQDTTLYRVLEFEDGHPPYDNTLAYWRIQNAYGYHGAKLRQIQDAFDVVSLGNPLFWGLMNVKYIISNRPDSNQILTPLYRGDHYVFYNSARLPRAFFVNQYKVASGLEILNQIKEMKFDPQDVAFCLEDPKITVEPTKGGEEVHYTQYRIQDFELKVKATGNNLLFLSESWYPAGWKAYLDGTEIPIYRLNYMFRGVLVPPGEHTITMNFAPVSFILGKTTSLVTNILTLGGLLFIALQWFIVYRKKIGEYLTVKLRIKRFIESKKFDKE